MKSISMVSGDNDRSITYDLLLDGVGYDLSTATIVCHMRLLDGTLTTITDVVAHDDQTTHPGRCLTTFGAADLVTGQYTIEWQVTDGSTIITFPGAKQDRPSMFVREEAD